MKKLLSLCLMLVVLSTSLLTSCSVNYKPISLKYRNSDYAPYTDGEPKSFLVDLLNNSKWHNDVAKCDCDYTVMMTNTREIFYHSECGTFIDYDFDRSLTVSEEDRVKLNGYFAAIMCESNVHCFDDNYRCTACGYVTLEHEHTYEYDHDDIGHGWSYTCGCMTPPNFAQHFDGDGDGKCDEDSCRYDMSENLTPTNHFLRNQAGCEWLNEIAAEDIAEIKIISGAVGVVPGTPNNVSSSTDEAVIARIFEEYYWLDTAPISKMEGQIDGGGGVTVKFILKDGTAKELYINNGNYLDTNGDYFELLSTPKFKDTDNATKAYGFITYIGTGTVYDKDNNSVCEIPIDELEYVITGYDFSLFNNGYDYCVDTEFGKLYFVKIDIFVSEGGAQELIRVDYYFIVENDTEFCYRLVGKNLDELIAEYSNK